MANEEHLAIVRQGVEVWNRWREEHPNITPDFTAGDFFIADLAGANLSGADFSIANLHGANLERTNLERAVFIWANLADARLYHAQLKEARIDGTLFADLDLRQVYGLDMVVHEGPSTIGIDTI